MTAITKAVIPAAGLGTRLMPATVAQPKEMLPVAGKPAIQYVIEEAVASGINDIRIITGRTKRAIEDHFDYSPELETMLRKNGKEDSIASLRRIEEHVEISYMRQHEQRGLGDAILHAEKFVNNQPFAVVLADDILCHRTGDMPCLKQLIEIYYEYGSVVAVKHEDRDTIGRYGVPKVSHTKNPQVFKIDDIIEKPAPENAPSDLAVIGRYVLVPEIFDCLKQTRLDPGGELQLTDALRSLCKETNVYAYKFNGTRYDIGTIADLIKANIGMALEDSVLCPDIEAYLKPMGFVRQR